MHYTKPNPKPYPIVLTHYKTDIKVAFVDATVLFELPYMQIWAGLLNRSYTGFEPKLLTSQLRLHTPWATIQKQNQTERKKRFTMKLNYILV